jgi:hypothetical protein
MKNILVLAVMLLLSGCANYAPGIDAKGVKLQQEGIPVLVALRNYMDETAHYPKSLQDLVPKYLAAIPAEPEIHYDPKTSVLSFTYTQDDKTGLDVYCHALVGQTAWVCT